MIYNKKPEGIFLSKNPPTAFNPAILNSRCRIV
jgi:hypothetical protein